MAKLIEAPRLFTVKKARLYFNQAGIEFGDQQVRNLMRTNDVIKAGLLEYIDPVTDEAYKVISGDALDNYIVWRNERKDEPRRSGRQPSGLKRYNALYTPEQAAQINDWLLVQGLTPLALPERKPRKSKVVDANVTNGAVQTDVMDEMELIEVA